MSIKLSPKLTLAIAFHQNDYEITLKLFKWIANITAISERKNFLIVYPKEMGIEIEATIREILGGIFDLHFTNPLFNPSGWPQGPNAMFDCAARWIQEQPKSYGDAWLWLEPDAIPLHAIWFDDIEGELREADLGGKVFLGNLVKNNSTPIGAHMNGVAVYPRELARYAPQLFRQNNIPFDIVAAEQTVPQMRDSRTIQHLWRPETFTVKNMHLIDKNAALFHQCKDGSLIKQLERICKLQTRTKKSH